MPSGPAISILLALIAVLALAVPAEGKGPSFGYNDEWFVKPDKIGHAVAGGANTIRVPFAWALLEPSRGDRFWSGYDDMYRRILASGARPLITVMGAPCWAARRCAGGLTNVPKSEHMDSWAKFVGDVARRYPKARGIEVWNEQNLAKFWPGKLSPRKYGRVLRAAGRGVRQANPRMPVVSGGLLPSPDDGPGQMAYPKFLKRSLKVAGRRNYDGVGIHPFPFFAKDYLAKVRQVIRKTRRITRRVGGRGKTIWVTEVGVSTAPPDNYSLRGQARALGRIYDALARMPDVAAIIVHKFMDDPRGTRREAGWGVTNPDGSPKPAFCALAKRRGRRC
jgi:polysaccharide biosynthesis protein PslG